jgi:hypothetical protein
MIHAYATSSGEFTTSMCDAINTGSPQQTAQLLGAGWVPTAGQFWLASSFFLLRLFVIIFLCGMALWLLWVIIWREYTRRYRYAVGPDEEYNEVERLARLRLE